MQARDTSRAEKVSDHAVFGFMLRGHTDMLTGRKRRRSAGSLSALKTRGTTQYCGTLLSFELISTSSPGRSMSVGHLLTGGRVASTLKLSIDSIIASAGYYLFYFLPSASLEWRFSKLEMGI